MNNEYPDGIGVEAFSYSSLEKVWINETNSEKREHLALNYYDYFNDKIPSGSINTVGTIPCLDEYSRKDIILDINTEEDYHKIKKLYDDLYPLDPNFSFADIIKWYDNNKELI